MKQNWNIILLITEEIFVFFISKYEYVAQYCSLRVISRNDIYFTYCSKKTDSRYGCSGRIRFRSLYTSTHRYFSVKDIPNLHYFFDFEKNEKLKHLINDSE